MARFKLFNADCLNVMPRLEANSIDSIVTDPPYGLKFMGKNWDKGVPGQAFWEEALRVVKPGAYLLAFGGTRTFHRLACAIEDAGWEMRDCIMWVYGSGFPKSLNVAQAIDKAARGCPQGSTKGDPLKRGKGGIPSRNALMMGGKDGGAVTGLTDSYSEFIPITNDAHTWEGYGTALKPAFEPILLCRKPLEGTVAANVLKYGTGAMNIDGSRVGTTKDVPASPSKHKDTRCHGKYGAEDGTASGFDPNTGRWPANLIHDGSEEVIELFPHSTSGKINKGTVQGFSSKGSNIYGTSKGVTTESPASKGSAARFFYCAKCSKRERGEGNNHPTVKPLALIEYLVKLVTPPNGTCLDPFMGSGTTGIACSKLGRKFVGIEKDREHGYMKIALKRIKESYVQD